MATTTTTGSRIGSNASLMMSDSSHQGQSSSQHHRISRSAGGGRRVRTAIVKQPGLNRSITAPVGNPQLHQRFNRCATVPSKQAKEQAEQEEPQPPEPVPHFRRSNTTFRSRLRQSSRQSITRMSLFGVHAASKRNLERMESTRDVDLLEMDLGDIDLHESKKLDVNPEDTPEPRGSSAASWIAGWFNGGGEPSQEQKRESTAATKDNNTHIVANWPWSQHSRGAETASTQPLHADEFGGDDHSGYEFQEDHSKPYEPRTGFGGYPPRGQQEEEEKDVVQEFIEARLNTFWSNIDVLTGGNGLKHHVDWDDDDELPPEEMEETSSSSHVSRLSAAGGHYGFTEEYEARYNY